METAKQILTTLLSKLAVFNDWLLDPSNQLLGILLGSFFTLIGVYLANRNTLRLAKLQNSHTHDIERNNLKREKLEELYLQISQWNKILSSKSISHVSAMNGDITYNQYLDILTLTQGKQSSDWKGSIYY